MSHPLFFYCHIQTGSYEVFYHHVEKHWGQESALCCNPRSGEVLPMEAVMPRHQLLTFPKSLQDLTNLKPRSILLQGNEQAVPIHGVVVLPKVQEYQEEGVLVYAYKILIKLKVYYSRPRTSSGPEPVEDVVHL